MMNKWKVKSEAAGLSLAAIVLLGAATVRAEMPPQPTKNASLVVEGVVREAFRSLRAMTIDYLFLIEVRSAKAGAEPEFAYNGPLPKAGDALYVYAFQRTPDAPMIAGPGGYRELPTEGSIIVAYLYPRNRSGWQFAYPRGFELKGRVAADDISPLSPAPVRPTPTAPVTPVAPVPVGPPHRLGIQAVPVVLAGQRGLRITMVVPGSVAARAGLVPGDVILKAGAAATGELSALVDQVLNSGPRLPLLVRRAGSGREDVVEVDFGPAP